MPFEAALRAGGITNREGIHTPFDTGPDMQRNHFEALQASISHGTPALDAFATFSSAAAWRHRSGRQRRWRSQ